MDSLRHRWQQQGTETTHGLTVGYMGSSRSVCIVRMQYSISHFCSTSTQWLEWYGLSHGNRDFIGQCCIAAWFKKLLCWSHLSHGLTSSMATEMAASAWQMSVRATCMSCKAHGVSDQWAACILAPLHRSWSLATKYVAANRSAPLCCMSEYCDIELSELARGKVHVTSSILNTKSGLNQTVHA